MKRFQFTFSLMALVLVIHGCTSAGEPVQAAEEVEAEVLAIRSEGFGGDFRSGYEDAFRALMDLM